MSGPVAAIDIGTTSTNLLIASASGETKRITTVTALGEGVDQTRQLGEAAMVRTLATLRDFRAQIDEQQVTTLRVAATSACRDAGNADHFFDQAEAVLGSRPVLLSGDEEARLSFAGALGGLNPSPAPAQTIAVLDIGGGSTELVVGRGDGTIIGACSLNVGARRLTEAEFTTDPPRPEELTNAIGRVMDDVEDAVRELPDLLRVDRFVGVASTITVVAAVELGLATFDRSVLHGFELSRDAAEDVFRTLATERFDDRIHNPGLPRERADVIVGGCCALVGVMRKLQLSAITVSLTNLLDGLAADLLARTSS
jgi:exopolyphosphatase / guanosine-5'-triphosphate,3'-diphosphate pyrophosphatase